MKITFLKATKAAEKIRLELNLNMHESLNIYDACNELGLVVRFVDIDMEGMYMRSESSKSMILLSNQRPLPRQSFTCGHELGHHFFGHGLQIDTLNAKNQYDTSQKFEELLVNAFSGNLLMPILGIQAQFAIRSWTITTSTPVHFYTISSYFGVGFHTLIHHCRANKLISAQKASSLLKYTPAKMFRENISTTLKLSHFKIVDSKTPSSIIELETTNYLLVSSEGVIEGDKLELVMESDLGYLYQAKQTGISTLTTNYNEITIRIHKKEFIGLANHRHI